jgi:conjugative relaxase-like TrwC/TraI family protein
VSVVLNIGKLAGVARADYYLDQVVSGAEDYYTGRREAPGYWMASASADLGLTGRVKPEQLRSLLAGQDPRSGEPLSARRSGRTVPGFDLTFRAPKSVSLLWGLSDSDVSDQVREAHDAAVATAVAYVEDVAARSRRGAGGREVVQTRGFVAAAFRHRASRAGDPLLHTHVLVANAVQTVDDGRWRTLHARMLYREAKTAGYLFQAQLRHELTRRLGVAWEPVTNGHADIAGIPRTVVRAFSQRRAEIEQRMAEHGATSARAAQVATLDTRRPKHEVDGTTLHGQWQQRASELGFDLAGGAAVVRRRDCAPVDVSARDRAVAGVAAPSGVTRHVSTFARRDVIQHLCGKFDASADAAQVLASADDAVAATGVVALGADAEGDRRYTTTELLAVERHLVDTATSRAATGVGVARAADVSAAVDARPTLHDEQAEMIRRLCRDGDGVAVVVGKAGTGKTFAVAGASEAWQRSGHRVIGCALAGRAAQELAESTGIDCYTITMLLGWLDRSDARATLDARTVLIVDEAGMVGTRTLARLFEHTAAAGAKLVLIGDHHQLPEIYAGGAFAGLVARGDPIMLTVNRRQRHAWERAALDEIRDGSIADALAAYRDHGRLTVAATADAVRELLVDGWWDAAQRQGAAAGVMVALRVAEIDDLNARARSRMQAAGLVAGPSVTTAKGVELQAGDRVVARLGRALPAIGGSTVSVTNGQRGTVTGVDVSRRSVTVTLDTSGGRRRDVVEVASGYLDGGYLQHGYAITGHRAQGLTAQRCWVLFSDALYRQWGYVALSRAREHVQIYMVAGDQHDLEEIDCHGVASDDRSPTERLSDWLHRSKGQQLALDFGNDH